MSTGELLLILFVALLVFGPEKLSMLAGHLGKLIRYLNQVKQQLGEFWQAQLNEQQLRENQRKAEDADAVYQQSKKSNTQG